jgi:UDP-N-acetylmuramoylalanine--D-glutamate ligase
MTDHPTIDPDALTLERVMRGAVGRVTVLGLARSGIALAGFFVDRGTRVTIYDGRPAHELTDAIAAVAARRGDGPPVEFRLGPEVDPATTWRDADLVVTSPAINPDYPTTEPRLRAALRDLVTARAAGDPSAPAVISEPDLFLRLCVARTIGVTGTKGKTTTASLTAAILARDPTHPAVLGGNIGIPLV